MDWRTYLDCSLLALAYVLPLHFGSNARPRDKIKTIKWRVTASIAVCAIAWMPLWLELQRKVGTDEVCSALNDN